MGGDPLNRGLWNLFFTVFCVKKGHGCSHCPDVLLLISDVCHALVGGVGVCQTAMDLPYGITFPIHTNILRPGKAQGGVDKALAVLALYPWILQTCQNMGLRF